ERLGAVEHPDDVRVPCDHPGVQWLAPVDGVVVAEPRVERERVLDVSPGLEIEVHRRGGYPAPVTLLKVGTGSPTHPATLRRAPSTPGFWLRKGQEVAGRFSTFVAAGTTPSRPCMLCARPGAPWWGRRSPRMRS